MTQTFRPIRVVMVIQTFLPRVGGAERQIAAQAPLLRGLGVDLHVVTRRHPKMCAFEIIGGIPIHRIPVPGPRPIAALSFIFLAAWKIRELKPDLVHAHELLSPSTTAVFVKWWMHLPIMAKVLRGGELGDIAKLKCGVLGKFRLPFLCRFIDAFAVISREIDAELSLAGVPEMRRVYLPNGVDTTGFSPVSAPEKIALRKRLHLPAGRLVIYSGRLQPEKQVDRLISLWPQVRARYQDAHLIILGTGPEEKRLREMAGDGIRFLGMVADVIPYLNAVDLYILPSSTEGLSNSLLEAMSCGLPVIATDVGAAPEMITHGGNGWLIPAHASNAMLDALLHLLGDEDARGTLGKRAREFVVAHYNLPGVVLRLRELYNRLLDGRLPLL